VELRISRAHFSWPDVQILGRKHLTVDVNLRVITVNGNQEVDLVNRAHHPLPQGLDGTVEQGCALAGGN
jgi:hypothetical protein